MTHKLGASVTTVKMRRLVLYTPARVRLLPAVTLAVVLAALGGARAAAQTRPLQTEPAVTAPAGTLVFETGFDVIADEPSYVTGVERTNVAGLRLTLAKKVAVGVVDRTGNEGPLQSLK